MKRIVLVLFCINCLNNICIGQQRILINKNGKAIQIDAFLIEWKAEDADTLLGNYPVIWDAYNTPQGLGGYFRYSSSNTCVLKSITLYPEKQSIHKPLTIACDTFPNNSSFYAIDSSSDNTINLITIEWLIPWDSISLDSYGEYEIELSFNGSCTQSSKPIYLSGKYLQEQKNTIFTPKIKIQIASILILLILFFRLRAKAKAK